MTSAVTILIPAAGASSRMAGRDKLAEPVGTGTALFRAARTALATGCRVMVTLAGPYAAARRAALSGLPVTILPVPDHHSGLSASLRAGAQAADGAAGLMIHLPDMPDIETTDMTRLLQAFARDPARPVRATDAQGNPGHPVIFPARLFPALIGLTGDQGGRAVLAGQDVRMIPLRGARATTDLDSPSDWATWRGRS